MGVMRARESEQKRPLEGSWELVLGEWVERGAHWGAGGLAGFPLREEGCVWVSERAGVGVIESLQWRV